MTDETKPDEVAEKVEYGIADFITEVDTVIWEKRETAKREAGRHNTPMAGLTNLRVDRLNALSFYLRKIENFQKGKAPAEKEPLKPMGTMTVNEELAATPVVEIDDATIEAKFEYSGPHKQEDIVIRETPIEEASDIEFTTEAPVRDDGWED